jgi:hypothetical protein
MISSALGLFAMGEFETNARITASSTPDLASFTTSFRFPESAGTGSELAGAFGAAASSPNAVAEIPATSPAIVRNRALDVFIVRFVGPLRSKAESLPTVSP